tara:strand:+ start:839 stop:3121 length:2283 start_codon:yes stop_codon:yes gene_type:complete
MLGLLGRAKKFITGKKQPEVDQTAESSDPRANPSAIIIRPKTTLVSPDSLTMPEVEENKKRAKKPNILKEIRKKVYRIDKILKKNLKRDSKLLAKQRRQTERIKRGKKENELEKVKSKDKEKTSKLNLPGTGLFKAIFDFISNIFIGRLLFLATDGVDGIPGMGILKTLGSIAEGTIDLIIGVFDALGSALLIGKTAIDSTKNWLKTYRGDEAEERFDSVLGALKNLFNAFVIVGSAFALVGRNPLTGAKLGGAKGALQKAGLSKVKDKLGSQVTNRLGSKIVKGGLGRTTTRLVGKTLGPKAMKAVGPVIKKIGAGFSRVPIVGSLIVAVSSLLAGEPLGQAAFKGLGSAIGGFAGSFIPIPPPIGTLIGSTIGTFIGDVLYVLILQKDPKRAGQMLMKGISDSFKMMFDFAGMAASFVKQGFERFVNNFPKADISKIPLLPRALGFASDMLGFEGLKKENGKVNEIPDLSLLLPYNIVGIAGTLIPHIAASFLPDIFGQGGVVSKIFGKGGTAYGGKGSESANVTETVKPTYGKASNLAGEAGKFIEKNLESAAVAADGYGDYNRITEHPDFGGVKGRHATGSYHYVNRAIDIGAFTNEQEPIVNVLNQFNKMKGVQPKELITGAQFPGTTMVDPGGHGDHVHVAYRLGGLVKGLTHAMLGEEGPEYVIDTDSYKAIEESHPGLFDAINAAKGPDAVTTLMDFTSYERPQETEMAMVGAAVDKMPTYSGGDDTSSMISSTPTPSKSKDSPFEITYKFG